MFTCGARSCYTQRTARLLDERAFIPDLLDLLLSLRELDDRETGALPSPSRKVPPPRARFLFIIASS